jgi:hypothetical protein
MEYNSCFEIKFGITAEGKNVTSFTSLVPWTTFGGFSNPL